MYKKQKLLSIALPNLELKYATKNLGMSFVSNLLNRDLKAAELTIENRA